MSSVAGDGGGVRAPVGLVYDERMCAHATPDGEDHPESPERIRAIWRKLQAEGIPQRCVVLNAKEAKDEYIASVHAKKYINLIKNVSLKEFDSRRSKIASKFNSIYFNKGSSEAAYLAAGSVTEVCDRVAKGDMSSAIAIVRPPGHHAEHNEAMGFCLFNNVAVAANFLLNETTELNIKKVLIVDWDVHHGNGTQKMFYKDHRVLFFSVHRFDFGSFYPAGDDGSHCMIGEDLAAGYNINVPWEHGQCGDADYNAVWDHILIPVAEAFNPDIILISAGFDAAMGDPLGGCCVTPYGYSLMLTKLMRFAQGKIVMVLEGGYNLNSLANSVLACAKTLLEEKTIHGSLGTMPFESTWRIIQEVRHELKTHWPVLAVDLPQNIITSNSRSCPIQTNLTPTFDSDVDDDEGASGTVCHINVVELTDTLTEHLSKLDIDGDNIGKAIAVDPVPKKQNSEISSESFSNAESSLPDQLLGTWIPWRSFFSKIEVWYASYGSNMWKRRFLCYIEGGKVEGMHDPCNGSRDKTSPKDVMWKTVPHRIFFGRSHTHTWGAGGVAFLHPQANTTDKAYICMYKITLEQFNDVLLQENTSSLQTESPILNLADLNFVTENKFLPLKALKGGWYSNVLYLGKEDNLPIITMTCQFSDVERFKSGELPRCPPSKEYMNTLVRGLVEGKQLSNAEAVNYISEAVSRKL